VCDLFLFTPVVQLLTVNLADLPILPERAPALADHFRRVAREEEGRAQAECEALALRSEQIELELEVASWPSGVLASLSALLE